MTCPLRLSTALGPYDYWKDSDSEESNELMTPLREIQVHLFSAAQATLRCSPRPMSRPRRAIPGHCE